MCYNGEDGVAGVAGCNGDGSCGGSCSNNKTVLMDVSGLVDLSTSDAVAPALESGLVAVRASWLVKETTAPMAIFLVNGSEFVVNREPLISILPAGTVVTYRSHVDALYNVGVGTGQDEGKIKCEVGVYRFSKEDTDAADWIILSKEEFQSKFMVSGS